MLHYVVRSYRHMDNCIRSIGCMHYVPQHCKTPAWNIRKFSSESEKAEREAKYSLENTPNHSRVMLFWGSASTIKKTIIKIIGGIVLLVYGVYGYYFYTLEQDRKNKTSKTQSYGELAVGGPFEFVNTKGETVSTETLKGNWVLLYFGFTYCPDICPEQMQMLGDLVDIAKDKHDIDIIPVMVTIDNERDTPEVLDEYIRDYNPKIVGLLGTDEQLDNACNLYRCYRSKGQSYDDPNDYILDHTVTQYLINPEGKTIGYFLSNRGLEERVPILLEFVRKFNETNNPKEDKISWFDVFKSYIGVSSVQS